MVYGFTLNTSNGCFLRRPTPQHTNTQTHYHNSMLHRRFAHQISIIIKQTPINILDWGSKVF